MPVTAELGILLLFGSISRYSYAAELCPKVCDCRIDERGRKQVRCEGGDGHIPDTVDIQSLDEDVEVLILSGTQQNPISVNLEAGAFVNKRFKEIYLSFSDLERLSEAQFQHVSDTLEVLNLTHNHLSFAVEQNFRNLSRLTHLHLDHNRIQPVFSTMFNFLSSLRVLTMSNNNITELPPRMALPLSTLEVLDLSSNPLGKSLTSAVSVTQEPNEPHYRSLFQDMPMLRVLRLSNTSLDGLPRYGPSEINNLEEFDLANNHIRNILSDHLSIFTKLKVLRLAGNHMIHIDFHWYHRVSIRLLDFNAMDPSALSAGVFSGVCIDSFDISITTGFPIFSRPVHLPISEVV